LGSPANRYDVSNGEAFRRGLDENALIDGQNVTLDVIKQTTK
jgi:hypothetical protein